MDRPRTTPPTYFEMTLDTDEPSDEAIVVRRDWIDEPQTARFDFEKPALTAEDKLVIGYLTMEEYGMFADLSVEEQQAIATTLRR